MQPKVGIVVLSYNSYEKVKKCVSSLDCQTYPNRFLVIVDNPSGNGVGERLKADFSQHTVLLSETNTGYAAGNNVGIRAALAAGADLIWILNYDALAEPEALAELVRAHQSMEHPGLVGSLTLFDQTQRIYFFKGKIEKNGRVRHVGEGSLTSDWPDLLDQRCGSTDYVNGTSILVSREVIQAAGLIPEQYFLYFEDPDWSLRVAKAGFSNAVAYRAIVRHLKADLVGLNYTAEYYCRRNEFFFRRDNGYRVSPVIFKARIFTRWLKCQCRALLGLESKRSRNMAYIMSRVMAAVCEGRMGREVLKLPYPEAH